MSFNRDGLFHKRTLAWRLFKRHHTHFNQIYWAHRAASVHAFSSTRPFKTSDKSEKLFTFASGAPRVVATLGEWADAYSAFDRWNRMAAIVAIAGYLETYIAQVSTAALESCPSLIFGGGPKVDGAIYLKNNPRYDLYPYTEGLTRGDWQSRISAYKKLFGACPFEPSLATLEELRKLRNDAGHSFGRDIKSMSFAPKWIVEKLPSISDTKMLSFLSLVDSVAENIEEQLASTYVGQYEIIKVFHRWLPTASISIAQRKELAKAFSVHLNDITANCYPKQKAMGLIAYYASL